MPTQQNGVCSPTGSKDARGFDIVVRPDAEMDKVFWATWYNVPTDRQAEFETWVAEVYGPYLKGRPGYDWVAHYRKVSKGAADIDAYLVQARAKPEAIKGVGTGDQYLLLAGSTQAATFLSPAAPRLEGGAPPAIQRMLDRRQEVRSSVMKDVMRTNGPAVATRPLRGPPAPRIQFGSWRTHPGMHQNMWEFYLGYRYPQIAACPGAVSARNVMGCLGWAEFGIFYEFESAAAHEHFWDNYERPAIRRDSTNPGHMQNHNISLHAPGSPIYAERVWPPVAPGLL